MKKLIIILTLFISFLFIQPTFGDCNYTNETDPSKINVANELGKCLNDAKVVSVDDANLSAGFKTKIMVWVDNIAIVLSILAVGSIVYGGLLMTLSTGDEEKVKKAKDVIKWGMLGFIGVISASAIITLVVNIMFSV